MTTPTDDRELLRTLAQACGWQVALLPEGGCSVIMPDGAQSWTMFNEIGTWDSIIEARMLPDWLNSVDAALSLPWPEEHYLVMMAGQSSKGRKDNANVALVIADKEYKAEAPTLARALCECFAQWWKDKEAGNG